MYEWHYPHFIDELTRLGHTVYDCNPNMVLGRAGTIPENSEILVGLARQVLENGTTMLLAAAGRDENLDPMAIEQLKAMGIPCVNLCVDGYVEDLHQKKIGKHFDITWVTHLSGLSLKQYGCNVRYLPMAANPFFFANRRVQRKQGVCFVGSRYGARAKYVSALAEAGLPIIVRGSKWTDAEIPVDGNRGMGLDRLPSVLRLLRFPAGRKLVMGGLKGRLHREAIPADLSPHKNIDLSGPVSLAEMVSVYSESTMSLGVMEFSSTHTLKTPLLQYCLREFETPMLGCAHLVCGVPELRECFEDSKEILFFSSLDECVDKARYYLAPEHQTICETIGRNARRRAENEHTWMNRFKPIWRELGIDKHNG